MAEVTSRRGVDTFLDALLSYDSEYATIAIRESSKAAETELSVTDYIADYREHVRRKQAAQGKGTTRTTMAATLRGKPQSGGPPPRPCLCGMLHWMSECYYLNEQVRPSGWKPKKDIQAQIQKKMSNPRTKAMVERALARGAKEGEPTNKDQDHQDSLPQADDPQNKDPTALTAIVATSLVAERSEPTTLQLSWIVDTGSSHHVCNRYMKKRFTKTRNAGPDDYVISGNTRIPVEAFGTVTVKAHRHSTQRVLTLLDTAYVPSFMANLVSVAKANEKNLYFMELNKAKNPENQITAGLTICKRPAKQWHEVFAHASPAVIKALPTATEGAAITEEAMPQHCD
ncbi:hypothetical protein MPH_14101, partial [Macrophomina phaseolina MS6]